MKRTGKEWNEIINHPMGVTIIDPDGFDRTNNSYEEKRISRREFHQRNVRCSFVPVGEESEEHFAVLKLG